MRVPSLEDSAATVYLLIITLHPISTTDCSAVQVDNAEFKPYLNGLYERLGNSVCAGRTVYAQDVTSISLMYNGERVHFLYLYHVVSPSWENQFERTWVIGRIMCNSHASARISGETPFPDKTNTVWEESHGPGWSRSTLTVTCTQCYTMKVSAAPTQSDNLDLSGYYDRLPPAWHCNNKSVWRRYVRNVTAQIYFLYIYSVSQGSMWVISDILCDKQGFARVKGATVSPELGTEQWEEYKDTEGWVTSNMGMECTTFDVDCLTGDWAAWSSCSKTCSSGIMSRNKTVVRYKEGDGESCDYSIQTKVCETGRICPDMYVTIKTAWTPGPPYPTKTRPRGISRVTTPATTSTTTLASEEMQKQRACFRCEKSSRCNDNSFTCGHDCYVIVASEQIYPTCERVCTGLGRGANATYITCCSSHFCPSSVKAPNNSAFPTRAPSFEPASTHIIAKQTRTTDADLRLRRENWSKDHHHATFLDFLLILCVLG